MKYDGVILIQGPSDYVKQIKKAWNGYNLIWSTWKGYEKQYDENDVVIFNDMPSFYGTGNVALQQLTVLNGIKKARELNYGRVLKWRSDMIPTNSNEFIGLLNLNAINMFFFHVAGGGYFVDYFMEGSCDNIYDMWDFNDMTPKYAERALTNNIKNKKLNTNIVFIGKDITIKNDIYWLKKDMKLSTYNNMGSGYVTNEVYYEY